GEHRRPADVPARRAAVRRRVMHYLLFYEKVADHAARQSPALQIAHRDHVAAAARQGELVLAGSLADPDDGAALLLFRSDSPRTAEAFARADPYVKEGVIARWQVRRWH